MINIRVASSNLISLVNYTRYAHCFELMQQNNDNPIASVASFLSRGEFSKTILIFSYSKYSYPFVSRVVVGECSAIQTYKLIYLFINTKKRKRNLNAHPNSIKINRGCLLCVV